MELVESIETINEQLRRAYGIDSISSRPIYRVVWANDELEKRLMHFTDAGIQLLTPEIREVPKYAQWAKDRYILERLSYVEVNSPENMQMTVSKVSYEPIWSFVDNKLNYLPPRFEVAKVVIDTLHAAIHGDHSLRKYKDDNAGSLEETQQRVETIQKELFGNETDTGDALAHGEAIVVPRNYEQVH
jgi:hypothetical protein